MNRGSCFLLSIIYSSRHRTWNSLLRLAPRIHIGLVTRFTRVLYPISSLNIYDFISNRVYTFFGLLGRTTIDRNQYDTYPSPSAEQKYWESAERGLRELRHSDARFVGSERPRNVRVPEMPPLVMYYVPALLPEYRDKRRPELKMTRRKFNPEEMGRQIEPKIYCKWHRIVFPGPVSGVQGLQN